MVARADHVEERAEAWQSPARAQAGEQGAAACACCRRRGKTHVRDELFGVTIGDSDRDSVWWVSSRKPPERGGMKEYIEELKSYRVTHLIRTCNKSYSERALEAAGIWVTELNCHREVPTPIIIDEFLQIVKDHH